MRSVLPPPGVPGVGPRAGGPPVDVAADRPAVEGQGQVRPAPELERAACRPAVHGDLERRQGPGALRGDRAGGGLGPHPGLDRQRPPGPARPQGERLAAVEGERVAEAARDAARPDRAAPGARRSPRLRPGRRGPGAAAAARPAGSRSVPATSPAGRSRSGPGSRWGSGSAGRHRGFRRGRGLRDAPYRGRQRAVPPRRARGPARGQRGQRRAQAHAFRGPGVGGAIAPAQWAAGAERVQQPDPVRPAGDERDAVLQLDRVPAAGQRVGVAPGGQQRGRLLPLPLAVERQHELARLALLVEVQAHRAGDAGAIGDHRKTSPVPGGAVETCAPIRSVPPSAAWFAAVAA